MQDVSFVVNIFFLRIGFDVHRIVWLYVICNFVCDSNTAASEARIILYTCRSMKKWLSTEVKSYVSWQKRNYSLNGLQ